jgi:hypothetical protein
MEGFIQSLDNIAINLRHAVDSKLPIDLAQNKDTVKKCELEVDNWLLQNEPPDSEIAKE